MARDESFGQVIGFEQSITGLETLRAGIQGEEPDKNKSKRKKEGVFYTPEFITHYFVEQTRDRLVKEDPASAEIIKPYLRGQDIKRWAPQWDRLWIILLKSSGDHEWPWKDAADPESVFSQTYPALWNHMKVHEDRLRNRQDKGHHWWELRACAYYDQFFKPKIIHTDITWRPQFAFLDEEMFLNNTGYIWTTSDWYLLACVNSPIIWAYMWRNARHGKDEALRLIYSFTESMPIPQPTEQMRENAETAVERLIKLTMENRRGTREVLDWLRVEHGVEKPGNALEDFATLAEENFVEEVRNRRPKSAGKLSPATLADLRKAYCDYAPGFQTRQAEAAQLENQISGMVNKAYGLAPKEIDLMWRTAPPRMPGGRQKLRKPSSMR